MSAMPAAFGRRAMLAGMAALPVAVAARANTPAPVLDELTFEAERLGQVRVSVWTPPDYRRGQGRHRVLYMHDGQNLFDPAVSGYGKVWHVDRAVTSLALGPEAPIVVGIWNPVAARYRTYVPAEPFARLSPDIRRALAPLVDGAVVSDAYLDFVTGPLKRAIDTRYRTRPDVSNTAIMGSSMGGLISLYAMVQHRDVFGSAACLSTHWPLFVPGPAEDAPYQAAVIDNWRSWLGDRLGPPAGRRIWFDHGTETLDRLYRPYQAAVDKLLPPLGWKQGRDFESRAYPGAPHEENAWAARLGDPLRWLYGQPGGV